MYRALVGSILPRDKMSDELWLWTHAFIKMEGERTGKGVAAFFIVGFLT